MNIYESSTIAAVSTPIGTGGIGIVRISGDEAFDVLEKIFKPKNGRKISEIKSHSIVYGNIEDNSEVIDEVLVSIMKAPNTYTRENVAEINCHGGIRAVQRVLQTVLSNGAVMAEPGEFTKRAFLNGRIDLTQAQAVIDIINAKTEFFRKTAVNKLEGRLSKKVRELRSQILTMLANIETAIDYPEHDDETMTKAAIGENTKRLISDINRLLSTADTGKILKEGIKTVIIGKPNVGKSSLLNWIIDEDKAIVTDIPGTTRDVMEEFVNINGIPLRIIDTAGIRETEDKIEKIGVEKSIKYANDADLVFIMFDASKRLSDEDINVLKLAREKKAIVIVNKTDLKSELEFDKIYEYVDERFVVELSVKMDIGFENLFCKLKEMFLGGIERSDEDVIISDERNKASLLNAQKSLNNVIGTIESGMPEDFISMDLTDAYSHLGEITGESLEEDIIDKIFSEFCLGK